MADDLGREAIPGVAGASGCPHPTRLLIPICSRKHGKAGQVDGADETLQGLKIAILVTDGFEEVELTEPRKALEQAGADTRVVSPQGAPSTCQVVLVGCRRLAVGMG